jgi:hypothetical protein
LPSTPQIVPTTKFLLSSTPASPSFTHPSTSTSSLSSSHLDVDSNSLSIKIEDAAQILNFLLVSIFFLLILFYFNCVFFFFFFSFFNIIVNQFMKLCLIQYIHALAYMFQY